MKSILIASTSTLHGTDYLSYLLEELETHFKRANEIIFIPYARPDGMSYEAYTKIASDAFKHIDKSVRGIHEFNRPKDAIEEAEALFVGGGNTFVLVHQLYKNDLINTLKTAVNAGIPYFGTSAGSNICGLTMQTTNDMPIVYPSSFKTMGLVPFNINAHYLDPSIGSKHMGESRETRIKEFHVFNTQPVIGLREGSWIRVHGKKLILKGDLDARVFEYGKDPYEISPNSDLSFLK